MTQPSPHRIAVLMGGANHPRAAARRSGEAVSQALRRGGYEVLVLDAGVPDPSQLMRLRADVVFLALREPAAHDGTVQGLLEVLGLPYTGSQVLASALACDRLRAKDLLHYHNIPTPSAYALSREQVGDADEVSARHRTFPLPAVVKPRYRGRAAGPLVVRETAQLRAALDAVTTADGDALVERQVRGRDVVVGLLDGRVLGVVEKHVARGGGTGDATPDGLSRVRLTNLAHLARAAYRALGCRGAACVDFVCSDQENDYVLGVDPLPLFTPEAALVRAAQQAGIDLGTLCATLVEAAAAGAARARPRALQAAPAPAIGAA